MEMIVAICQDKGIGSFGGLPWPYIQSDMNWFRHHTTDKIVVMGSGTFESMGKRGLKDRDTYVITRNPEKYLGIYPHSPKFMTMEHAKKVIFQAQRPVIIIGGDRIYKEFFEYIERVYLTVVDFTSAFCDKFLSVSFDDFDEVYSHKMTDGFPCTFKVLERKEIISESDDNEL